MNTFKVTGLVGTGKQKDSEMMDFDVEVSTSASSLTDKDISIKESNLLIMNAINKKYHTVYSINLVKFNQIKVKQV